MRRVRRVAHTLGLSLLASLLALPVTAAPSRGFGQEFGRTASSGVLYFDLYNSTGTWSKATDNQIRMGLPWGEAIFSERALGYKHRLQPYLAAYAFAGINTSSREASYLQAGASYLLPLRGVLLNFNPEALREQGSNRLVINGAAFFALRMPRVWGKWQLGGEFSLSDQASNRSSLALGLRWLPREAVTLDIILAANGGSMDTTVIRTPAALRLNLRW